MRPGLTFDVTPVELVDALKRDGAAVLGPEQFGDFLPRATLLALLPYELNEGF